MKTLINRYKLFKRLSREIINIFQSKKTETKEVDTKYSKILFCPMNASQVNTLRESLIAEYCKKKGAENIFLFQKEKLSFSFYYKNSITYLSYIFKLKQNIQFVKKLGFKVYLAKSVDTKPTLKFSDVIKNKDDFHHFKYQGIQIGDLILADTIRTIQCPEPLWDNAEFLDLLEKAFDSAIKLFYSYQKTIEDNNPDKIVMSHGIYSLWGILFRIARQKNIAVDVYNGSYRKNTLRMYHNVPNAPMPMHNWKLLKDKPLTNQEIQIVDDYLKSRKTQKNDNIKLFDDEDFKDLEFENFIKKAKKTNGKIACAYANIAWDAYAFTGVLIFENMMDWLEKTIQYYIEHSNHYLIIKSHPVESIFNVPEPYRIKAFVNKFDLPDNIYFLDEYSKIKPFELYDIIDFGIVNISTVSIEMALMGKTVITSGPGGQYSNKGFTVDPNSIEDYNEKLKNILNDSIDFKPDKDMAKRYLYFRFFKEAIPFNVVNLENVHYIEKLNFKSEKEFMNNQYMKILGEGVLNDGSFILSTSSIQNQLNIDPI